MIINLLLILFGAFSSFKTPADPDFGWHYKYGEYIFQHHQLLRENVFSYTFPDYHWANSYWLSELIIYTLTRFLGPVGMSLFLSLVLAAFVVWLLKQLKQGTLGTIIGGIILFTYLSVFTVTVRPLYFSCILLLLLVYILLFKEKYVKFLPILFLFWANLHADFVPGLFILAVYTGVRLVQGWQKRQVDFILLIISLFSLLATLINPYGINLWLTLFKESNPYQFQVISEWEPISLTSNWIYYISMIAAAGFGAASAVLYRKKENLWYLIVCLIFFGLSMRSVYFERLLLLITVFAVVSFWTPLIRESLNMVKGVLGGRVPVILHVLMIMLVLVSVEVFLIQENKAKDIKTWSLESKYPYEAIQFIKENHPSGRMFNPYNWGGYLIWQLPEYQTFVDGRMTSWREEGKSVFEDYINISSNPRKYLDLFNYYQQLYDIRWLLDKNDSKLAKVLVDSEGWKILFQNETSLVISKD